MYCRKCGKEIHDDSVFCSFCGEKLNPKDNSTPAQQISNIVHTVGSANNICSMRIASLICSAIILLLSFAKWIHISLPVFDYVNGTKSSYSTIGFYNAIKRLEEMGVVEDVLWVAIVLIVVNLLIIILTAFYSVREWFSDPYERDNENIIFGYTVMNTILVTLVICMIGLFIINQAIEPVAISFAGSPYIILILAAINRFLILPKYNDMHYYNVEMLSSNGDGSIQKQHEQSKIIQDKKLLANNGWRCSCGKVNPQYTGTCSCGNTKYENQ